MAGYSEGSVHKKPWVHDSILETQRNEYEVKIAALEAECKRYREALEKIKLKRAWKDKGHICQSKQELESAVGIAHAVLEAQDADK